MTQHYQSEGAGVNGQFSPISGSLAGRFLRCGAQNVGCWAWDGAPWPRSEGRTAVARQAPPIAQDGSDYRSSVGEHVFVVRGRVHIVARFVGIWTREALWRRSGWRVVPGAEMPKDLLHHPRVINHAEDPHRVLADRAAERIDMPHAQDQVVDGVGT